MSSIRTFGEKQLNRLENREAVFLCCDQAECAQASVSVTEITMRRAEIRMMA